LNCIVSPVTKSASRRLRGRVALPGDKSVSHRALLFALLNKGTTRITGLLESEDTKATRGALLALGAKIVAEARGEAEGGAAVGGADVVISSPGMGNLKEPEREIDCMNSGTTARVLSGILAGEGVKARLIGDPSLSKRPMRRVVEPLAEIGAKIRATENWTLPLLFERRIGLLPAFSHTLKLASAQVKTSLMLAALYAESECEIQEPLLSRDHTERLFALFGIGYRKESRPGGGLTHRISPTKPSGSRLLQIPGDISSASFFLAAAAILPENSEITIENSGINPTRTELLALLTGHGLDLEMLNVRLDAYEPVADLRVRSGAVIEPFEVTKEKVPGMIDEIPLLALIGARIKGRSSVRGAEELRFKESDRIAAVIGELGKLGVVIEERKDGFTVEGPQEFKGAVVDSHGDHRIGMLLFLAGLISEGETVIRNMEAASVSFPGFLEAMRELGASFRLEN
jgi:3-phosphoshikimate 1-carboxyvinyltransferase